MRTLKKTLCLVLALVMVLGLCAFNVSAAEFTDSSAITYKDAVGVMRAAGVLDGFTDGSFRPTGTLTRAQAAKMIACMMDFGDLKGTSSFTDCKGHWGDSYIAFCVKEGIVAGYGDGTFGPDDTLTGSQWAKMVICAIGYNAAAEGISGSEWEIAVAKMVKSLKLAVNIDGFDGTKQITREEACEMGFQGMMAALVKYTPGITVNGVEIPGTTNVISPKETLLENLGITKGSDTTDDAGRPAKIWVKDGKPVVTIPETAVYTTTSYVADAALAKALKPFGLEAVAEFNPTANGVKVEIFEDGTVVVTDAELDFVVNVVNTKATKAHGAYTTYSLKSGDSYRVYSTTVAENEKDEAVIAGSIAKGDAVLVVFAGEDPVPTLKVAKTVSGALTEANATRMVVGGKAYAISGTAAATGFEPLALERNAEKVLSFYVDEYSNIIGTVEATEAETKEVQVMVLTKDYNVALSSGKLVTTYTVKAADVAGKVAEYNVSEDTYDSLTTLPCVAAIAEDEDVEGCYTLTEPEEAIVVGVDYTAGSKDVDDVKAGTATKFIYANFDAKSGKPNGTVTTLALAASKGFDANEGYYVSANGKVADVVFVIGKAVDATTSDEYVYLLGNPNGVVGGWTLDVIIKGEETTITVKEVKTTTVGFYKYIDAAGNYEAAVADGNVLNNYGGYLYIDGEFDSECASTVPVYVIDVEAGAPGATMTWGDVTKLGDDNDEIYVVKAGTTVLAIYVLQNAD